VYGELFAALQSVGAGSPVLWTTTTGTGVNLGPGGVITQTGGVYRVQASCASASTTAGFAISIAGNPTPAALTTGPSGCGTATLITNLSPGNAVQLTNLSQGLGLQPAPTSTTAAMTDIVKLS
jgi:hypothetical protein